MWEYAGARCRPLREVVKYVAGRSLRIVGVISSAVADSDLVMAADAGNCFDDRSGEPNQGESQVV